MIKDSLPNEMTVLISYLQKRQGYKERALRPPDTGDLTPLSADSRAGCRLNSVRVLCGASVQTWAPPTSDGTLFKCSLHLWKQTI